MLNLIISLSLLYQSTTNRLDYLYEISHVPKDSKIPITDFPIVNPYIVLYEHVGYGPSSPKPNFTLLILCNFGLWMTIRKGMYIEDFNNSFASGISGKVARKWHWCFWNDTHVYVCPKHQVLGSPLTGRNLLDFSFPWNNPLETFLFTLKSKPLPPLQILGPGKHILQLLLPPYISWYQSLHLW